MEYIQQQNKKTKKNVNKYGLGRESCLGTEVVEKMGNTLGKESTKLDFCENQGEKEKQVLRIERLRVGAE